MHRIARTLGIATLLATALTAGPALAGTCDAAPHPGGEWPSYGGDLANTRFQAAEDQIGPSNVDTLEPKWNFSFAAAGATGSIQSTPAIAGGCVFVSSDSGWVFALDADDGSLQWSRQMPVGGQVPGIFSLAIEDGRVLGATADEQGPFGFALSAATGEILWESDHLPEIGTTINAGAVVYDGALLIEAWGDDPDPSAHSGFALVDTATGDILKVSYTIPEEDWEEGHAGGGLWSTAAIDPETGYGYIGTSNPYSKKNEHENTNAIIKIDLNRDSETYGEIVGSYKGTWDNYAPGLYDQPVCQTLEPTPAGFYNLGCLQLDIDFGASPSVWSDSDGNTLVGALQKSGIFHVADADTMEPAWTALLSAPLLIGNSSTATVIDDRVVVSANPGVVWSLDEDDGSPQWLAPTLDLVRYQAMSSANGVVYTVDGNGNFDAFDAATGAVLLQRSVVTDAGAGQASLLSSPSVAIARNRIYAPISGVLVAYGLPT